MLAGAGCQPYAVRSDNNGLQHEVAPSAIAFALSHVAIYIGIGGLSTSIRPIRVELVWRDSAGEGRRGGFSKEALVGEGD